ncbi:MAG TPA: tetratricopeptide repeat protein [Burkholderiales bacterium]|nr:tetratricopeptide repeat protein [Burkholderiales bacterium]
MRGLHQRLLILAIAVTLTAAAMPAFPAPQSRGEALAALEDSQTERRAEAVVWMANHGTMDDQPLLLKRLRDESAFVRGFAEQGLWLLWSRSGNAEIDRLMATGVEQMQSGAHAQAIATFSEVIRRNPGFAEGWNKRATVHYLAGEYRKSLEDCAEVVKRNPWHFGALSGFGQVYFRLEEYGSALEWWRRALEVNPNMLGVEMNIKGTEELLRKKRGRAI